MAEFKEINAEKFREKLIGNFGDNDKVNILFDELVQKNTEKNPFFYSAIVEHIEKNNLSITDLIDGKNQVNLKPINVAIVRANKEYEMKKVNEEQNNARNSNANLNIEDIQNTDFDKLFKEINFDNLKSTDYILIGNNWTEFIHKATYEQITEVTQEITKVFPIDPDFEFLQNIRIKQQKDMPLTKEEKKKVKNLADKKVQELGFDKTTYTFSYNFDTYSGDLILLYGRVESLIEQGDPEGAKVVLKEFPNLHDKGIINIDELSKQIDDGTFEKNINKEKDNNSEIQFNDKTVSINSLSNQREEQTLDLASEIIGLELGFIDSELEFDDIKNMQEVNEEQINVAMNSAIDYADSMQVEQVTKETVSTPVEEMKIEQEEQVQGKKQEEVEEIAEEQYEAPTFEVEEKTGLAGLFSRIANSRAVKAVTNLFKPKEEQKKLNAPANQRVEDGVRFTDYVSKGSLPKNIMRDIAVSTVEAVSNFAKNISGRTKKENETILNRPIVIKTEPTKEQTEKTVTQEQQTVEKTETFNDTNKWAVSNEAIQRQDAINKAQERNNISHVAAPKQEERQSEEDKSFEEI